MLHLPFYQASISEMNLLYSFREAFVSLSSAAKILYLMLVVFLCLLASPFVATLVAMPFYGISFGDILHILTNLEEQEVGLIRLFQITQTLLLFFVPALLTAAMFSHLPMNYLYADRRPNTATLVLAGITLVTAIPLLNAIAMANASLELPESMGKLEQTMRNMEDQAARLTELFLKTDNTFDVWINLGMVAVLPAIAEEFLFRGILQRLIADWTRSKQAAAIISAFLFSFIHFQFYGFIPRFLLGLYFGYLLIWTGTIWVPVVAHFVNNGLAVIYYSYQAGETGKAAIDTIGTGPHGIAYVTASAVLTGVIIVLIVKNENWIRQRRSGTTA